MIKHCVEKKTKTKTKKTTQGLMKQKWWNTEYTQTQERAVICFIQLSNIIRPQEQSWTAWKCQQNAEIESVPSGCLLYCSNYTLGIGFSK